MPQQKISTFFLILIVTIILFSLSCPEEIPEGPPLVQVIEASLTTDRQEYPQPSNYGNRYHFNHISNFNNLTNLLLSKP